MDSQRRQVISRVGTGQYNTQLPVSQKIVNNQKSMYEKLGVATPQLPETTTRTPSANIFEQGGRLGGQALGVAGKVIATGVKSVGSMAYNVVAGGATLLTKANPVYQAYVNNANKMADQIFKNANESFKSGFITSEQYKEEIERSIKIRNTTVALDNTFLEGQKFLGVVNEQGELDLKRTALEAYSGLATVATLPIGGLPAAVGTQGLKMGAMQGLAAVGREVVGKQTVKSTLGSFATLAAVSTKQTAKSAIPKMLNDLGIVQKTSTQGTLLQIAKSRAVPPSLSQGAPQIYKKTAEIFTKAMNTIPGLRMTYNSLLKRAGAGTTTQGVIKDVAIELAIRAPIRRENIQFATETVQAYKDDKWFTNDDKMGAIPATILGASMLLEGGPLGPVMRGFSKIGKGLKVATYGEASLADSIYKYAKSQGFDGNAVGSIYQAFDELPEAMRMDRVNILKQLFGTNLRNNTADKAAYVMINQYLKSNPGMQAKSLKEFYKNAIRWAHYTNELLPLTKQLNASGKGYAFLAKFSIEDIKVLQTRITEAVDRANPKISKQAFAKLTDQEKTLYLANSKQAALQVIQDAVDNNEYWAMNDDVVGSIVNAINNAKGSKQIKLAPSVVNAGNLVNTSTRALSKLVGKDSAKNARGILKQAAKDGYTLVTVAKEAPNLFLSADEAAGVKLKSVFVEVDDAIFERAAQSQPGFRMIGTALTRLGLGFDESAAVAYRLVRDNSAESINTYLQRDDGRKILNALQQSLELPDDYRFKDLTSISRIRKRTAVDLRMMTPKEMKNALSNADIKLTDNEARLVRKAIIDGHLRAPLQTIGLADKLIAGAYKYNPFYRLYARTQGALRYTYNPFFNVQELVESEILGQAVAGGKTPWLMGIGNLNPQLQDKLDDTIKQMERAGFFNSAERLGKGIDDSLMSTRFGEGAQDVYLGRVSASINLTQKRSIAGVVAKIADSKGLSIEDLMRLHGAEVEAIVRPIVQYPTKGALNSNLIKAMNIAVFPSRYNIKVATMAAQTLAKQTPAVQAITINKLWEMQSWLNSPEGIAWRQDNSKAIDLVRWITPVGSVEWVFNMLGAPFGKGFEGWGDIGVIGGLPFGVITQILESQGLVTINTPYVSPETGDIYSRRIPESMKARMASAFMDLLGSTFTYPGRTLGLPGKQAGLRQAAAAISLDTKSTEWTKVDYEPQDLPNRAAIEQAIWNERYSVANGIENITKAQKPISRGLPQMQPIGKAPQQLPETGRTLSATAEYQIKQQMKANKKAAAQAKTAANKAAKQKAKTTAFPANLPQ